MAPGVFPAGSSPTPPPPPTPRPARAGTPSQKAGCRRAPGGAAPKLRRRHLASLARQTRAHLARTGAEARLEARIASFETAFRMQMHAPKVFDLSGESKAT